IRVITTESTVAKIGRSMKNFEIMDALMPWHEPAGIFSRLCCPSSRWGRSLDRSSQYRRSAAILTSPYSPLSMVAIARGIAGFPGGGSPRNLEARLGGEAEATRYRRRDHGEASPESRKVRTEKDLEGIRDRL